MLPPLFACTWNCVRSSRFLLGRNFSSRKCTLFRSKQPFRQVLDQSLPRLTVPIFPYLSMGPGGGCCGVALIYHTLIFKKRKKGPSLSPQPPPEIETMERYACSLFALFLRENRKVVDIYTKSLSKKRKIL